MNCLNLQGIGAEDTLVTLKGILSIERACAALRWISVSNIHNIGSLSCLAALQTLEISDPCLSVSWKLEVSDFSITDEFLLLVAKASLPLQRLTLFSVANFTLSGISSLLYAYQTLKSLSLIDVNLLTDESMKDLSQYLQCLVTINLSHCMNLTVSTLFTLARNCPSLEAVNLGYTGCVMIDNNDVNDTGLGMKDYFHTGVKNPRIRTVCLKFTPYLNDDSLTKVALMCPNTETLDVHGYGRVTEAGIASALEVCNHIRNLDFGSCPLIKHIGKGTELPDLQVINAAGSALSDEGLAMIGSRCPRLLKLNLEKCEGLTAEGIQAMVKSCTSLREINLRCCHQVSSCSLHRIVFSSSSLRRVFPPSCDDSYNDFRGFSLQNKCLVSSS